MRAWIIPSETLRITAIQHCEMEIFIDPPICLAYVPRMHGEPGHQRVPGPSQCRAQIGQARPGSFRVDVVDRDGRDAPEIRDARLNEREYVIDEVRGRLDRNIRGQDRARERDGIQMGVRWARGVITHRRARFGYEVLDDDFLNMAIAQMGFGDRLEGCNAIAAVLTDSHQDPRSERDRTFPRRGQRCQAPRWSLIRCPSVCGEILAQGLDHHALAWRHGAQSGQILGIQCPSVRMREQSRFIQHQATHRDEVIDRGVVPTGREPVARFVVTRLGELTEREECFMAPNLRARGGDRSHLIGREERISEVRWSLSECAVAAPITTQLGERDEHLGRKGDDPHESSPSIG